MTLTTISEGKMNREFPDKHLEETVKYEVNEAFAQNYKLLTLEHVNISKNCNM